MRNEEKVLLNGMHDRVIDNCSRWDIFTTTTLPQNKIWSVLYNTYFKFTLPHLVDLPEIDEYDDASEPQWKSPEDCIQLPVSCKPCEWRKAPIPKPRMHWLINIQVGKWKYKQIILLQIGLRSHHPDKRWYAAAFLLMLLHTLYWIFVADCTPYFPCLQYTPVLIFEF